MMLQTTEEKTLTLISHLLQQVLETPDFELHLFGLKVSWSANRAKKDYLFSLIENRLNPFGVFIDDVDR
jgi:hypothetical protein